VVPSLPNAVKILPEDRSQVWLLLQKPFFKALGVQTIVLGPGDINQAHRPDESLALDRIPPMQELLRQLIRRLCVDILAA